MVAKTNHTAYGAGASLSPRLPLKRFEQTRRWAALGATIVALLGYALAFGEAPSPCREAYLEGGFGAKQISFNEFRELYGDTVCASEVVNATPRQVGSSGTISGSGV